MNPENKQFWTGIVVGLAAGVGLTIFFQSPSSGPYTAYNGLYPQQLPPQYYPPQGMPGPAYVNPAPQQVYSFPFPGIEIGIN